MSAVHPQFTQEIAELFAPRAISCHITDDAARIHLEKIVQRYTDRADIAHLPSPCVLPQTFSQALCFEQGYDVEENTLLFYISWQVLGHYKRGETLAEDVARLKVIYPLVSHHLAYDLAFMRLYAPQYLRKLVEQEAPVLQLLTLLERSYLNIETLPYHTREKIAVCKATKLPLERYPSRYRSFTQFDRTVYQENSRALFYLNLFDHFLDSSFAHFTSELK